MKLAPVEVGPNTVRGVDLSPALAALPAGSRDLGLELVYEGPPGRLAAELLMIDRERRSVAQGTPKDAGGEGAAGLSLAWRLAGRARTVIAVGNPSVTEEATYHVFLQYPGGSYTWAGDRTLAPGEVRHIDIRRLRDEQVEGEGGALLPEDVVAGQAKVMVRGRLGEKRKLVGEAIQVDGEGRMTGFLSCPYCPPEPSDLTLSPLSFTGDVGTSQQIYPWIWWSDGTSNINNNPNAIDWYPGDSAIATVSEAWANFRVQFQSPGTTTIGATMPNECSWEYDYSTGECNCAFYLPVSAQQPAGVTTIRVDVTAASIPQDRITVVLEPAGVSGTLVVEVRGATAHTVFTGTRSGGTHQISFGIPSLPNGQEFTEVKATWNVGSASAADTFPYHFRVLGDYNHTKYNTPNEAFCTGPSSAFAYTSGGCGGDPGCSNTWDATRKDQWFSELWENGSGYHASLGFMSREWVCSTAPARQVPSPCPQCGGVLSPNQHVAVKPGHPFLNCGDTVYVHGIGTRTVKDKGGGLAEAQLDHYIGTSGCNRYGGSYGNHKTIKLY